MKSIDEIQKKLAPPPAPAPPPGLLEAITREIPDPLPALPQPAAPRRTPLLVWGSIAASLLFVVLVAGTQRSLQSGGVVRTKLDSFMTDAATEEPASTSWEYVAPPPREVPPMPTATAAPPTRLVPPPAYSPLPGPAATPAATPAPSRDQLESLGYTSSGSYQLDRDPFSSDPRRRSEAEATGPRYRPHSDGLSMRESEVVVRPVVPSPAVATQNDPLSTFALDVDTGSYTLLRNHLRNGMLPPPGSVRVEEVVNALDYGDPAPEEGDFAIHAEGAPTPFVPGIRYRLLRIGLKAREVEQLERRSAMLTFLVDTSGSMASGNRLGIVTRALGMLLRELRPDDRIALVTFGTQGRLLLRATHDHRAIEQALRTLVPDGNTNLEQGLDIAYEVAGRQYREGGSNRCVGLSDGVANVGLTEPEQILGDVEAQARRGIELTSIGVGMGDYNDALMERLADLGDGRYAYVDSADEAHRLFVRELTGTLESVATDAKVQVTWNPVTVQSYRLLGYENRAIADGQFRNDAVDAGEIGSGHAVTALYEIKLATDAAEGPLATVNLRYRRAAGGPFVEYAATIRSAQVKDEWEAGSRSLRLAAVAAELAETLRGTPASRPHDREDLLEAAHRLAVDAPGDRGVAEILELVERTARLR